LFIIENANMVFYILTYIICSIPFGMVLTKLFTDLDLRSLGSGSIGATNVLRVLKKENHPQAKKLAIATLLLDLFKAIILLSIAKYVFNLSDSVLWFMGFISIIGHCYSVFLLFEGGKGVATFFGVALFMMPLETLIGAIIWGLSAKFIKISSISSLLATFSIILTAYIFNFSNTDTLIPIILMFIIVLSQHTSNITRLFNNEEKQVI